MRRLNDRRSLERSHGNTTWVVMNLDHLENDPSIAMRGG